MYKYLVLDSWHGWNCATPCETKASAMELYKLLSQHSDSVCIGKWTPLKAEGLKYKHHITGGVYSRPRLMPSVRAWREYEYPVPPN